MVVYVVHTRREQRRGWGGGEASAMTSKNLVRLTSRAVAPATPTSSSSSTGGRSLSRAGGRPLRAASPPPPALVASAAGWESRTLRRDGEDWEEVVAAEATEEHGVGFGVPPTDDEVRAAVDSIKKVFENSAAVDPEAADLQALALPISGHPLSSGIFVNHFALDSDPSDVRLDEWTEPAMLVLNSSALLTKEHRAVLDAFHLLQEDTSVQKMVMALSTDKAVWDAVMNNEVVQEFKKSFQDAKETDFKGSSTAPGFMMWVLESTQAKIREFLEKILGLVNMLFHAGDKNFDMSDDVVRMSFMLSVFVFIVVTVARIP
ncbi:hypothetical protein BS78_06G180900 [Paspalum vaginatum]|nr:hypothetical protein BS78_06G180900 [Paspalum vaginatum]